MCENPGGLMASPLPPAVDAHAPSLCDSTPPLQLVWRRHCKQLRCKTAVEKKVSQIVQLMTTALQEEEGRPG